jgi:hypothetical protein
MTVLKPQVLIAGLALGQEQRWKASVNGVIIARVGRMARWTKRWAGFYIKNVPDTAVNPTTGQKQIRTFFGYLAHNAPQAYRKGLKATPLGELPPVAAYIHEMMKGVEATEKFKSRDEYPSRIHRTYNKVSDLVKSLGLSSLDAAPTVVKLPEQVAKNLPKPSSS